MPKRISRDKLNSTRVGIRSVSNLRKPESVKALLSRVSQSALRHVAEQRQAQVEWQKWLEIKLPEALRARITGVVEKPGSLIVYAESAAWSARLRFALAELDKEIRAENAKISSVTVRVLPRR